VTFTNTGVADRVDYFSEAAVLPDFRFGSLTWTGGGHVVRSPVAVAPAAIGVEGAVAGHDITGNTTIHVDFGYDGDYVALASGLALPQSLTGYVTDDPLDFWYLQSDDSALPDHISRHRITVPAGTRYLRVALASTDAGSSDDLDLYLQCPGGSCPGGVVALSSATDSATEVIDLINPAPGEYVIDVHGYQTDEIVGGPGANYELGVWTVSDAPGPGGFAVVAAPAAATVGGSGEVTLGWEGLDPGELYLGLVTHGDGEHELALTLVEIATP
jgi:hypothetical protein